MQLEDWGPLPLAEDPALSPDAGLQQIHLNDQPQTPKTKTSLARAFLLNLSPGQITKTSNVEIARYRKRYIINPPNQKPKPTTPPVIQSS